VRKTERAWRRGGSQFEIIEKPVGHTGALIGSRTILVKWKKKAHKLML